MGSFKRKSETVHDVNTYASNHSIIIRFLEHKLLRTTSIYCVRHCEPADSQRSLAPQHGTPIQDQVDSSQRSRPHSRAVPCTRIVDSRRVTNRNHRYGPWRRTAVGAAEDKKLPTEMRCSIQEDEQSTARRHSEAVWWSSHTC